MPKLCIALDTEIDRAKALVDELRGYPVLFKVGHKLFLTQGRSVVEFITSRGFEVFLDLKFHDIPNTVALAVSSAQRLGVNYMTVHALGGRAMLEAAVKEKGKAKILSVSLLTSHGEEYLGFIRSSFTTLLDMVLHLAEVSIEAGADGIVCSGFEVDKLKTAFGGRFIAVVPGIRLSRDKAQDQRRVLSPKEAVSRGADIVVMGREIINSPEPRRVVDTVLKEIEHA
jgi:orotidine-5'-phosphate decarboxylase